MITNKERSYLRSLANGVKTIFNIGKEGITENLIKQLDDALEKRELIKIGILNNIEMTPREASDVICSKLNCEGVQAIGNKLVLYRKSKKKPKIDLSNIKDR